MCRERLTLPKCFISSLFLQNNVTVSPAGAIVTTTNNGLGSSNGNNGFTPPLFSSPAVLTTVPAVPSPPPSAPPALPQQPQPKVEVKPINEEMGR